MRRSANVAVIGAGASGLVAVRELLREGHRVTCYEVASHPHDVSPHDGFHILVNPGLAFTQQSQRRRQTDTVATPRCATRLCTLATSCLSGLQVDVMLRTHHASRLRRMLAACGRIRTRSRLTPWAKTRLDSGCTRACACGDMSGGVLALCQHKCEEVCWHPRHMLSCRYKSLRTNLPREIMGYQDFPCLPEAMGSRSSDPRRYPGHAEVSLRPQSMILKCRTSARQAYAGCCLQSAVPGWRALREVRRRMPGPRRSWGTSRRLRMSLISAETSGSVPGSSAQS